MTRLWPRSLTGQMLLAVAVALLLAQGIGTLLLWRAQMDRRDEALIHTAAMRLIPVVRDGVPIVGEDAPFTRHRPRGIRLEQSTTAPLRPGDKRDTEAETQLSSVLVEQGVTPREVMVIHRGFDRDQVARQRIERRDAVLPHRSSNRPDHVMLAAVRIETGSDWLVARVFVPGGERLLMLSLIGQTLFIYALLVGAIALILRRITRPLAALTLRNDRFAQHPAPVGQMVPEGPDDVRRLIEAHNGMEARVAALLDEKDVMLGAIGHDLKTPLAALRVRIESVEDESERARMAATIEDLARTLDDILSLARVGRPSDPREHSELSALIASVVEEYEDMGEPVELGETTRLALPLRATWLRRALRNLIGNALRYGIRAEVSLLNEGERAVIRVDDDGPGIADADLARMLEPFVRGEPSRNSETGGAGLGLTLARAIAEQHGGKLVLANRCDAAGAVEGLRAELSLPLGSI